jgi:hypothetical protein
MKPLYLFEEDGKVYAKDALGNVVPVDLGGGQDPSPTPTPAEGIFYPAIDIPWSQGQDAGKVAIEYFDSKVVSQAYRIGALTWISHMVVISNKCAFNLPEPSLDAPEWEWKLPWASMARGYWTAPARLWTAGKTYYLDGMLNLRTAVEDGLEVCYVSIRVSQPDLQKKGIMNKRGPFAEPWGNGFIYRFTLVYPGK